MLKINNISSILAVRFNWPPKQFFILILCSSLLSSSLLAQGVSGIPADKSWKKLTVREKIGQLVIANFKDDLFQKGNIDSVLVKYPLGGIFMAEVSPVGRKEKFQHIIDISKHPILLISDNAAGAGNNFDGLTQFTTIMGLGATASPTLAYNYAKATALESRSIGIKWIFSPVVDLNLNPFNPVANARAFGDDFNKAYPLAKSYIKGLQDNGVAACAKHFPGDGVDYRDQHIITTSNTLSSKEWYANHGKMFKSAIDDGVYTIMAGHITLPFYQKKKINGFLPPATLSEEILKGLLRKDLNFKGVIVSDALIMGGFIKWYSTREEREVACFKAGCDMLLWPDVPRFFEAMERKISSGEITMAQLDESVERIWWLKEKLGILNKNTSEKIYDLTEKDKSFVAATDKEVAEKSITLKQDLLKQLPFKTSSIKKVLLVTIAPLQKYPFGPALKELARLGIKTDTARNDYKKKFATKDYDLIIYAVSRTMHRPLGGLDFQGDEAKEGIWQSLVEGREKTVVVAFGSPYFFTEYFEQASVYLDAYSLSAAAQIAAIKALFGEIPFEGKSPISRYAKDVFKFNNANEK